MERLTAEDLVMLWPDARWPQDVGALAVLDGRGLFDEDGRFRVEHVRAVVAARLHRVPRFRQVLLTPRRGLGGPLWVDAPAFDLTQHIDVVHVGEPGEEALLAAVERLAQQRLNRSRPLWEMWFLTTAPGRVALFVRMHHTMGDGIASMATLAELLDDVPDVPVEPARPWTPAPPPTSIELLTDNLRTRTRRVARALAAVARPATWRRARDVWPAVRELAATDEVSQTSLNQVVGAGRHLAVVRTSLDLVKAIGRDHGASVNDVLLTLTASGLRALLNGRGEPVDDLRAGVYVPVTLRRGPRQDARGNLIAQMVVTIPLGLTGPRRLEHIAAQTAARKLRDRPSLGWLTTNRITRHLLLRVVGHQPVNVTTADLPGPDHPVYLAGSRLLDVFPILPLIGNIPLAVGALSYAGTFTITVVADPHIVPDLAVFTDAIRGELHALATPSRPAGSPTAEGAARQPLPASSDAPPAQRPTTPSPAAQE